MVVVSVVVGGWAGRRLGGAAGRSRSDWRRLTVGALIGRARAGFKRARASSNR